MSPGIIKVLRTCLESDTQAGLELLKLYPHIFYLFKDFYSLVDPLLKSEEHKYKVMNIILNNVVEIYSMCVNRSQQWDSLGQLR